jgi:hypothetical protein
MPKLIDWKDVALGTSALDAERVLGSLNTYEVFKCNQLACVVCPEDARHKMRCRLLKCESEACATSLSSHGQTCPRRGKTLSCMENDVVLIFGACSHLKPQALFCLAEQNGFHPLQNNGVEKDIIHSFLLHIQTQVVPPCVNRFSHMTIA